jgi:hypothetical protein
MVTSIGFIRKEAEKYYFCQKVIISVNLKNEPTFPSYFLCVLCNINLLIIIYFYPVSIKI